MGYIKEIFRNNRSEDFSKPTTRDTIRNHSSATISLAVAGTTTFCNGDGLCFFAPDGNLVGFRVNRVDEQGRLYPAATPDGLRKGIRLYRNFDAAFEHLLTRPSADRRIAVRWLMEEVEEGFRLTLTTENGNSTTRTFAHPHEAARTPQSSAICRQLLRLGDTPFVCAESDITLHLSAEYFIPSLPIGAASSPRQQSVPVPLPILSNPPPPYSLPTHKVTLVWWTTHAPQLPLL